MAAVDKPAGWLTHAAGSSSDAPELLAWAKGMLGWQEVRPAHRLDLDTSGIVLLAATRQAAASLAAALDDSGSHKEYLALVFGHTHKKGVIDRPLADGRRGRPLEAHTRYRRLESFGVASLLSVTPITGRKHQIRRHLQGIGHPVVGDRRYLDRRKRRVPAFPGRLWLHAHRLHLADGRSFEAELPTALAEHLELLRT